MPIKPYDVDPRSDAEKAADEKVLEIEDPGPNRIHEVMGLVSMMLLSLIAGILIEKLNPPDRGLAVGATTVVVTAFLGIAAYVIRVVTRRRR